MIPYTDDESASQNYPIEQDDSFTPDQIEEINDYKEKANKKIAKNESVLRGLETFFWGISSYSLCKWLVLNLGSGGINLAIAVALVVNQIVNRDCLDAFTLNRKDGQWELDGMGKLFKFLFGILASIFVVWSSIGNFIGMVNDSKATYHALNSAVEEFNSLPEKQQEEWIKGAVVGAGLVALVFIGIGVNKK
ncbi:hypothetical protein I8748_27745 [Nostoc sp. CENA67]|uniref:Uncharacterized protein n=1 Tax=Amazonocrinis nigriterrae CENA67 TaxID=2794033 RepID=A0A8J7HU05_9NOST|nr:hypothetical protein [Amazonocrinis nigriterrae]MBH8565916.1 hypothetical protein [Amazonocrinis nigriterrae CENA67]